MAAAPVNPPTADEAGAVVYAFNFLHDQWFIIAASVGAAWAAARYVFALHVRVSRLEDKVDALNRNACEALAEIRSLRETVVKIALAGKAD